MYYKTAIYTTNVNELKEVIEMDQGVRVGGCIDLTTLKHALEKIIVKKKGTTGLEAVLENLKWFAGTQIRNVAAFSGNLVTASPISDLNPILVAMVLHTIY